MSGAARWLTHPAARAGLALAAGLFAAAVIGVWGPQPAGLGFEVPSWLANALGASENNTIRFARPRALWLVPLAVLPYALIVARRSLVDLRPFQVALQTIARLLVIVAAAAALAQPSLEAPIRGKTVVLAVDVSRSIDEAQLERARELVIAAQEYARDETKRAIEREDRTRVRVVTYAAQSKLVSIDASDDSAGVAVARHEDGLASDHAGALRIASALIDPNTEGRIVLVSDGTGSAAEREDLAYTVDALSDRGISVHTRSFEPTAAGDVLVEAVHLPAELRMGETFEVAVDIVSSTALSTTVGLTKNGEPNALEPFRAVELVPGRQQIKFTARATDPGPIVFAASLRSEALPAASNRTDENDRAAAIGEVRGRPRILLMGTGPTEPLAAALRVDHLAVETVGHDALPTTVDGLRPFDLVIFSDVPASMVGSSTREALDTYVREFGGGFVMIGGDRSFGLGNWDGTSVERILPVKFDGERQREQPKLALVLVIDKSGSMAAEDKLDLVKEASRATARTLDADDELAVIAFDARPHVLVRLQPAGNRIRIDADIRRLQSGGGTNALPALREAYLQLAGSNALIKHVILLSDGQSPESGITALLGDMRDADITVSAVGVGADAGKDLLRRIATGGRGRFYYSQDGTDVPRIFSRETREVTRNAVVERALYPRVAKAAQVLRGIDFAGAPGLRGIVPVKPKPLAEVLLRTHTGDPLLVRGRYGIGRTVAFASDAKPRWAAAWMAWSGFAKLWSQIARDTMRQGAGMLGGASIAITPGHKDGNYRVRVDVDSTEGFANELVGEVEVLDPAVPEGEPARTRTLALQLVAPGRYEADIRNVRAGQRLVTAKLYDESQSPRRLAAEAVSAVSVPYPAELAPDQLVWQGDWLASLASATHTGDLAAVMVPPGEAGGRTRSKPLWPHVLWALLLPLLVLDLALRRVSLGRPRTGL